MLICQDYLNATSYIGDGYLVFSTQFKRYIDSIREDKVIDTCHL
jgi:hypothetical protein